MKKLVLPTGVLACLVLCVLTVLLIPTAEARGKGKPKPPAEAFEVCTSQAEEASCSFAGPRGEQLEGTCVTPPRGEETLVCRPSHGKRGNHQRHPAPKTDTAE